MSAPTLSTKEKIRLTAILAVYIFLLGSAAGAIVWAFLKLLHIGMLFFWKVLPTFFDHRALHLVTVCLGGGLLIGIFQRHFGILPDTMKEVMAHLKKEGIYESHGVPLLITAVLLPLYSGGSLGPEAGLTGIITTACCRIGDRLRYTVSALRHSVLIGRMPTFGVLASLPYRHVTEETAALMEEPYLFSVKERKLIKRFLYGFGILAGVIAAVLLTRLTGGGAGLPQLRWERWNGLNEWKYFPLFVVGGICLGHLFQFFGRAAERIAAPVKDRRILSCLIAGAIMAALGLMNPHNLFSGGPQLLPLSHMWTALPVTLLFATAVTKILGTTLCLAFGWKGGSIFPIVYSAISLGYGLTALTGVIPLFAITTVSAATCGTIFKKPVLVVAVLLLCFPVRIIVPMALAAIVGARIGR
ncbi:MAG: chloride channel protein [Acidaminococcus sp.]|jgi:H+/Cl- antiporter ClcA|nr:chloride channel protein [Acidaminococcus sp.]MCI2115170.1 chloride channel protein [Acidaminococcus sp.]MCI2117242.1 chloride channel protein [Acidaminococcus sp.]